MIGHIAEAYRHGRLDARSGSKARRPKTACYLRVIYLLGWRDETRRMKAIREYPQLEMSFPEGTAPENRLPQIAQDRRSQDRMNPNTPEMD